MTTHSPISLADVQAALGDTDPNRTNARVLRVSIGRGSYATIQKHLDAIRAERGPVLPTESSATPAPPAEAVAAIWAAAWAQAQVLALSRIERLSAERDAAQALAETRAQDVAQLAAEVDAQAAARDAAVDAQAQALATAQEATQRAESQAQELAQANGEIERLKAATATAQAMAEREFQIERQTLQAALERQIEKYTDLKNVVDRLKPIASN